MMTDDFYSLTPDEQAELTQGLATKALKQWNLEGAELTLISMRENAVYRVDGPAGERYAMRVHRYGYHSDAALRSEHQWSVALLEAGLDLPPIIPTVAGEFFCIAQSPGVPEPRQVEINAWVDGRSLAEALAENSNQEAIAETFETIGKLAAKIHNQAAGWRLPKGFVRHAWDADGLAGEQPFWGRFWELPDLTRSQRELVVKARDRVHADLLVYGRPTETYSLIHADLIPDNLLVEDGAIRIIDFDDAGFGWHQFELANVLIYWLESNYFDAARDALVAGYRKERDLSEEALSYLPLFYLARALAWLGWSHTRSETETAQIMRPVIIELACSIAEDYLSAG